MGKLNNKLTKKLTKKLKKSNKSNKSTKSKHINMKGGSREHAKFGINNNNHYNHYNNAQSFNKLPEDMSLEILYNTQPEALLKMTFVDTYRRNLIITNLNSIIQNNNYFKDFNNLFNTVDTKSIFLNLQLDEKISNTDYKKFLLYCKYYETIKKLIKEKIHNFDYIFKRLQFFEFIELLKQTYNISDGFINKLERYFFGNFGYYDYHYLMIKSIIKLIDAGFDLPFIIDKKTLDRIFNEIKLMTNLNVNGNDFQRNFVKYSIMLKQYGFTENFIKNSTMVSEEQIKNLYYLKTKGFDEAFLLTMYNNLKTKQSMKKTLQTYNSAKTYIKNHNIDIKNVINNNNDE